MVTHFVLLIYTNRERLAVPSVTVIVLVLIVVPVFGAIVSAMVPSLVPVGGKTVSHGIAVFTTVHDEFDLISACMLPPVGSGLQVMGETMRVVPFSFGDCVTATVFVSVSSLTLTIIVPVLIVVSEFGSAVSFSTVAHPSIRIVKLFAMILHRF